MKNKKSAKATKKNLTAIFNSFAKKAVTDFPDLESNFLFHSIPTNTTYTKITDQDNVENIFEEIEHSISNDNSQVPFALKVEGYNIIVYKHFSKLRVMTSFNDSYRQEVEANLEHELGHLIAPAGGDSKHSKNFCECVADSFSFIRLQKKYKNIFSSIEATSWISTENFIMHDERLHFTSPALIELGFILKENELPNLNPVESANMAYRLALKYALSEEKLYKLSKVFEPIRRANKTDHNLALNLCAKLMLEDHGYLSGDVFAIAKTYIEPFLDRNRAILGARFSKKEVGELEFNGAIWEQVKVLIKSSNVQNTRNDKLNHLELLGVFDKNKLDIINPVKYEKLESIEYRKRAKLEHFKK